MEVGVSALRAELRSWIERATDGEEVLVTERGIPIARLLGVDSAPLLQRLIEEGVVAGPGSNKRPKATGRRRVRAKGTVSEYVSRQRD